MRISDWRSDVCSSDLLQRRELLRVASQLSDEVGKSFAEAMPQELIQGRLVRAVDKIGRASCRERVCQYVSISVVAVYLKKKHTNVMNYTTVRQYNIGQVEYSLFTRR